MPSFPVNRRFCTAATCWRSRITNSEEGVVQCAPMVNVPHSPLHNFIVSKKVQWGPAASSFNLGNAVPLQYYFTIQYNWSNNRANNMDQ